MALDTKTTLHPGDKIFHLFDYKEVLIKGSKESFIIRIEKVDESKKNNDKSYCQHVRAMG